MSQKILFAFAMFVFANLSSFAQDKQKLEIGASIQGAEIEMKNATGKPTTINKCMGTKGLLVIFSCNTCPFVVKNQEVTSKALKYATSHQIGAVVINSNEAKRADDDSYEAMRQYALEQKYAVPYLLDEESIVANKFGAYHTPEVFLFNSAGKLVYKGAMTDNPGEPKDSKINFINNAIDGLVAGTEIKPNTTKSVGCSIKRIAKK